MTLNAIGLRVGVPLHADLFHLGDRVGIASLGTRTLDKEPVPSSENGAVR